MLEFLLDLLYPKYLTCSLCQRELEAGVKEPLCLICKSSFQYSSGPSCEYCGKLMPRDTVYFTCASCKLLDLKFERGTGIWLYDDFIKPLIFNYKYKGHTYLYDWFSDEIIKKLTFLDLPFEFDSIVSVPMHEKRRKNRGYDPVRGLCEALSNKSGIPYIKAVERKINTPQLHAFSADERKKILSGAFEGVVGLSGNILLIDDIFTTGQTINHCASVIKDLGGNYVYSITLCVGE